MAENLRVTHYSSGSPISKWDSTNTAQLSEAAYGLLHENEEIREVYGLLYTGAVIENSLSDNDRLVCPENWHIPSDNEFKELEILYLEIKPTSPVLSS